MTATPENIIYMYDVERVIRLPIPNTGKACPDLERRLFAPQRVIDDYLRMMCLQTEYLNKIDETKNSREDMARIHHRYRLSGSLDRIKLGLKPKYAQRCFKIDVEKHNARAQERLVRIEEGDITWQKSSIRFLKIFLIEMLVILGMNNLRHLSVHIYWFALFLIV